MVSEYSFIEGSSPVLVSIPHSGTFVPENIRKNFTKYGRMLPDTDWHISTLYNFLEELDVSVIKANYSRYVIDLNRSLSLDCLYPGKIETELCPTTTFMGDPIYTDSKTPSETEISERFEQYWMPYHKKLTMELNRIKSKYGYAILWDAHSIQSQLPRFFEGTLPDLNLGTNSGNSCSRMIANKLKEIMKEDDTFESVVDGRFKGGYITRQYGNPAINTHAVQMEIAQLCYMNEYPTFSFDEDKAKKLRPKLKKMFECLKVLNVNT